MKNITEFLSLSSRVHVASQISWSNPTLLEQLVLLVPPLHPLPHLPTYHPFLPVNMPVTELPVPIYPPTYQQENFAFVKVWDGRLMELHSASSRPQKHKMSLTQYMKQLEEELVEEDVKLLQKKAKKSADFKNSLEYLFNVLVPFSWPMSGFSHASYNSSFPISYSNFLELNSASLKNLYVPYSSCDDLSICVQKGFIIDTEIDNPHYFVETNLILFENHAHLPSCASVLRPNTKRHPSKEE